MCPSWKCSSLGLLSVVLSLVLPLVATPADLAPAYASSIQSQHPDGELRQLLQLGQQHYREGQFKEAIDVYQRSLVLLQGTGDNARLGEVFYQLGNSYYQLNQYLDGLKAYEQALAARRAIADQAGEGTLLNSIGRIYDKLNQPRQALKAYERALEIRREIRDDQGEAITLADVGTVYRRLGNYARALELYQRSLAISRTLKDALGEAEVLNSIGLTHEGLGQNKEALEAYQQSLLIFESAGKWLRAGKLQANIGSAYVKLGQLSAAEQALEKALTIARSINNLTVEATVLTSIGIVREQLGQYAQALMLHQQALTIFQSLQDPSNQSQVLLNLGMVYEQLGQYPKASEFYQQAFEICKVIRDRACGVAAINNLGTLYRLAQQNDKALDFYEQALRYARDIDDASGEATALNNLGVTYSTKGKYHTALEYYQQALAMRKETGDLTGEGITLSNMGSAYQGLRDFSQAQTHYQKALGIVREIRNRQAERIVLSNIAHLMSEQKQPELAIAFYKESVNVTEGIRADIRILDRTLQESYTQSVAGTYRNLADLLIQQGRLSEAQAVLELLKLRELREFTRDAGIQSAGISLAKVEEVALKQILEQFTTVGNFTQELVQCQQTNCPNLKQLQQQRDNLYAAVNQEMQQQRAILAKHFSSEAGSLTPDDLNQEARRIVNAQPGTVLIYPLVLKDKIQFLVAFQAGNGAVIFRPFESQVSAEQLFKTIQTFRQQLGETNAAGRPKADLAAVKATSQQLYTWLIKPLEAELNNPAIKHLVFAPDSTTRYIPLAALYDGKQYLIQRFTISTITAASRTDTEARMPKPDGQQSLLLAMGASTFPNLNPLDNVPAELDAITKTTSSEDREGIYPGSQFLNSTFDYEALKSSLDKGTYRILHLATHGAFKPGRPEDSYLVPGNGQNLTTDLIDQLGNYGLRNIHLVVLSACETAVGDRASDGIEIPGISYFFLKNEVKSVMASLWNVNDASTALIMQQFYKHVAAGKTKAEALQAVQQDFIQGKLTAKDAPARADVEVRVESGSRATQSQSSTFSHPYYWAPFILIGNSL